MAPTSDAPARKKGFDLGHPGGKEYFIVGGVALGIGLVWFWLRKRMGATSAAAATTAASAPATPTGTNTSGFSSWVHDHQSSSTTTTGDGDKDHAKKVTVPDVTGEKYPVASKKIAAEGLIAQRGSPYVGKVVRESPHAGTKVKHGSVVTLSGEPWPGSKGHAGGGHGEKHHCPEGSEWDAAKKRCVQSGPAKGGH